MKTLKIKNRLTTIKLLPDVYYILSNCGELPRLIIHYYEIIRQGDELITIIGLCTDKITFQVDVKHNKVHGYVRHFNLDGKMTYSAVYREGKLIKIESPPF
jgi:antitoxin component YwqK of YwqJK toxin-antitoxin module